jgi:2-polyprenyl-3-methyl-5-hydroxy-6-metoxy-1,4-benzoquinol methylase
MIGWRNLIHLCNYCESPVQPKLSLGTRPIVNDLSFESAENTKRYLIEMTICENCGLHQLIHEIESDAFYSDYMTPSSWKSEPHLSKLVDLMIELVKFEDSIMDIGCNDGKFLMALKNQGFRNLYGVEPTKNTAEAAKSSGFRVTNEYLDIVLAESLAKEHGKFDVVVTRQVLEHIKDIKSFLASARTLLKSTGILVIEVPDSEINFKHSDYGVWEEHVNYFTQSSLTRILSEMGWEITNWYRSVFSGWCQTLVISPTSIPLDSEIQVGRIGVAKEVGEFNEWVTRFSSFSLNAREEINNLVGETGLVGILGVGSRSISTLYSLGLIDRITAAYDDSKEKIGKYIPGTSIQIAPSDQIRKDSTQLILLGVNSENEEKVLSLLSPIDIKVKSILPPSGVLLWNIEEKY